MIHTVEATLAHTVEARLAQTPETILPHIIEATATQQRLIALRLTYTFWPMLAHTTGPMLAHTTGPMLAYTSAGPTRSTRLFVCCCS